MWRQSQYGTRRAPHHSPLVHFHYFGAGSEAGQSVLQCLDARPDTVRDAGRWISSPCLRTERGLGQPQTLRSVEAETLGLAEARSHSNSGFESGVWCALRDAHQSTGRLARPSRVPRTAYGPAIAMQDARACAWSRRGKAWHCYTIRWARFEKRTADLSAARAPCHLWATAAA